MFFDVQGNHVDQRTGAQEIAQWIPHLASKASQHILANDEGASLALLSLLYYATAG
jgi:hypothetical protein